jgi:hypothetical protein
MVSVPLSSGRRKSPRRKIRCRIFIIPKAVIVKTISIAAPRPLWRYFIFCGPVGLTPLLVSS